MMKKMITVVVILLWNTNVSGVSSSSNANITPFTATCEDEVPDCGTFHKDELCNVTGKFKRYAAIACRKTCGYCTDHCVDKVTNCMDSTFEEACLKNITWSLSNCPVYCGFCGVIGRFCNKSTDHVCKRIPGARCNSSVCTCDAGFRLVADIECEEVYWKKCNTSEDCDRLDYSVCDIPQHPETTHSPWTNSSHCICKSGYVYNLVNHSCDAVCPAPVNEVHAVLKYESLKRGNYTYNDTVEYECETGYEFKKAFSSDVTVLSRCTGNRTWSVTPTCTIKVCPHPVNGIHAVLKPESLRQGYYVYYNVVHYACETGYEFNKSDSSDVTRESKCTENKTWSITPTCTIKDCGEPRIHGNGTVDTPNGTTYQAVITYSCKTGFDLLGSSTSVCQPNKTWSVAPPTCKIKDSCSVNCFPQPTNMAVSCDVTSGECLYGCQHGFSGHKCLFKCPHNCGNSTNSREICNTSTSECLFGCKEGFYGPNCTETCSNIDKNCKACHQGTDGSGYVCTECNRNFYRDNDRCIACSYWCKVNVTRSICRESDGFCEHGCKSGRFGYHCSQRCSTTCKDVCHRDTGRCLTGCFFQGYCGPTCEITCNYGCTSQQCNQSCNCLHGCIPSRWGKRCELFCNSNCKHPQDVSMNICNITDGSCIYGCLNNSYWGSQCELRCSSNCVSGSCHQISNICDKGCVSNRFYDGNCSIPCSKNCLNLTCTRNSGYCEHGCQPGWYGDTCDRQCGDSCFGKSCNQSDGKCLAGCQTGWYGKYCTQTCNDRCAKRTCSADTGNCSQGCVTGFQGSQCDIALATPRKCFGCDDMSSPQYCDAVVHCQSNEICFLESHISGHEKNFRSGCMDARYCHRIESNASSVCAECCTTDMCNNRGCGNTKFPAREQRGPVCFDCHHTGNPNTCEKVAMCSSNQVCSIEKFQWGDNFHYKQGCAHPVCNPLSRRKRSLPICHSCCDADYCNLNCTADATSTGVIIVG